MTAQGETHTRALRKRERLAETGSYREARRNADTHIETEIERERSTQRHKRTMLLC